jgi:hypothetical protein
MDKIKKEPTKNKIPPKNTKLPPLFSPHKIQTPPQLYFVKVSKFSFLDVSDHSLFGSVCVPTVSERFLTIRVTLNGQKWSNRFETVQMQKVPNGEWLGRWMSETLAKSRSR